ncbi:MAG: dodecin family protein [Saprospiraceae bacterium]
MAVLKVIELLSSSPKSFEDAIEKAVKKAEKSLKNLRSANVKNMSVTVDNGKIKEYRVNLKITFELQ